MSIISAIFQALLGGGGGSGPDYGPFDPKDFTRFQQATYELQEADEDNAAKSRIYAKYGVKGDGAWGRIAQAFYEDNKGNPDFHVAGLNPRIKEQIDEMSESYAMPEEYLAPIEGVGMDRLAAIVARREAAGGPAQVQEVLGMYGLDEVAFQRINSGWQARMGGSADAMAAQILGGFWHTYMAVARSAVQKAA